MKIQKFSLKNFKGIKATDIEVAAGAPGNIITLIGLNESGKTTILEGIANFVSEDPETSSLVGTIQERESAESFVPKSKKGIFSGSISIQASVALEPQDEEAVARGLLLDHKFRLEPNSLAREITIERRMTFSGGDLKEDRAYWWVRLKGRKGRSIKVTDVTSTSEHALWQAAVGILRARLPKVVYFPTFLFSFPERIYLKTPSDWDPSSEVALTNRYYRRVLQDVADSIRDPDDPKQRVSIEEQVVKRLETIKEPTGNPFAWWAHFTSQKEYDKVRAVLNLIAQQMGATIFPAWNQIFKKPTSGKRVELTFGTDPERDNVPWVQVAIVDGASSYSLSERSLGFRWFFSFLLFTQFRKARSEDSRSVFLFDEPASNLHALAQKRLMEGFSGIVSDDSYIIYSTHSQYLVNPLWLDKAYIVKNTAIDYESDLDLSSTAEAATNIQAINYRSFLAKFPDRVSYFQPALDALQLNVGRVIPRRPALIVEGLSDFHLLEYMRRKFKAKSKFDVYVANGSDGAATLISLFRGWGMPFAVLLDDDAQGRQARRRYVKEFALPEEQVITLGELSAGLAGKSLDALLGPELKQLVSSRSNGSSSKKLVYSNFFLERTAVGNFHDDLGNTDDLGKDLVTSLAERLNSEPISVGPA